MTLKTAIIKHKRKAEVRIKFTGGDGEPTILKQVDSHHGYLRPDMSHLIDVAYQDIATMRKAILDCMANAQSPIVGNVSINQQIYNQWIDESKIVVEQRIAAGFNSKDIPPTKIRTTSRGDLLVFIQFTHMDRVAKLIPKGEWSWKPGCEPL